MTNTWKERLPAYYANAMKSREKEGYEFRHERNGTMHAVTVWKGAKELGGMSAMFLQHCVGECLRLALVNELEE